MIIGNAHHQKITKIGTGNAHSLIQTGTGRSDHMMISSVTMRSDNFLTRIGTGRSDHFSTTTGIGRNGLLIITQWTNALGSWTVNVAERQATHNAATAVTGRSTAVRCLINS